MLNDVDLCDAISSGLTGLYLDTTYCNPKYNFPLQDVVINQVTDLVATYWDANDGKTLFLFGAYTIGKENVYLAGSSVVPHFYY